VTFKLIFENLRHRPLRSLLSALLIGVMVTLILTLVGLSRGMLEESAKRTRGAGADILVRPPGSSFLSLSSATMSQNLSKVFLQQPHVMVAVGTVIATVRGITSVSGVDLQEFEKMSGGFEYLQGGPFRQPDDVLIDDYYARQNKLHVGDPVTLLNRQWRVAGIYVSGKLSHIVLPMPVVQELQGNTGKVTQFYLKLDNPANTDTVIAGLRQLLPGYQVYSMQDILTQTSVENVPGLSAFIHVVEGIAVVITFAVVCLSMYMAVLQRTREIGILKSLGASRGYILEIIVAEALLIGAAGTMLGIALSFAARRLILTLVPASLQQAIVPDWWPIAGAIALAAALLGALYPGLRAARQDPIEALSYE
jgi:putative ABC transport system permease protein